MMETKCTQTKLEDKELSDFLPAAATTTGTATTTIITTTTSSSEAAKISDAKVESATDVTSEASKPVDKPSADGNAAVGVGPLAGAHLNPDPSAGLGVEFVPGGDNTKKQSDTSEAIVVVTTTTSNPEVGAREQTKANVTSTADGAPADQQQRQQQPPASSSAAVIGAESKGELGTWTRSTAEVCPWEDE